MNENTDIIVKKHQQLIHNARYKLSELSIKLISTAICQIRVDDEDFKEYKISLREFKELTKSNSNDIYNRIDFITDELMSKPFKIDDKKFNWLSYAEHKKGEGIVNVSIDPRLKPYLVQLQENFLQYDIKNILTLRSSYVIRMYEICKDEFNMQKRYKKNLQKAIFELKIDEIREKFQVPKSQLYADIKIQILNKSVKQFADKTDIKIEFEEKKKGRKVDSVVISVSANKTTSNYLSSEREFINYIRKNFVHEDIYVAMKMDGTTAQIISVNEKGHLYDKRIAKNLTNVRSKEIWGKLYKLAIDDKLTILKQQKLF